MAFNYVRSRTYATATSLPPRIVASVILSRSPVVLPALSSFEAAYYAYGTTIRSAMADNFNPEFYFRKGSQAEKSYLEAQAGSAPKRSNEGIPVSAGDKSNDAGEEKSEDQDLKDLNRLPERTLYLLLKKSGRSKNSGEWQFRMSPQAALVELYTHISIQQHKEVLMIPMLRCWMRL